MKKITILLFVFLPFLSFAQNRNKPLMDVYITYFIDRYENASIDYSMQPDEKSHPIDINTRKISPIFARFLYTQQKNKFCYKNNIFYWNETPILLFEEINEVIKKFPGKNMLADGEEHSEAVKKMMEELTADLKKKYPEQFEKRTTVKTLAPANGVLLYFTEHDKKHYLHRITIDVDYLNNPKNNDYGVFMIESFPLKKSYMDRTAFNLAFEKLNEISKYNFGYSSLGGFSTPFNKVEISNMDILSEYFEEKKFKRTQRKTIYNQITFDNTAGYFRFDNKITYDGIDPEYKNDVEPSFRIKSN